jgi:O-6-methylguanine DNA methyltransferase
MIDDFSYLDVLVFKTPIGFLMAGSSTHGVRLLTYLGVSQPDESELHTMVKTACPGFEARFGDHSLLLDEVRARVLSYLNEGAPLPYFALDLRDGTPFQQKVWEALVRIPMGETRSYRDIAVQIGHPRSSRAVGQACARNPILLLVPCHRVTAGGGGLGGFSCGLHVKEALLSLERKGRLPDSIHAKTDWDA